MTVPQTPTLAEACVCSFASRLLKGIRGPIVRLPPILLPKLKKNPAQTQSRNPSTTAIAAGPAEASPGRRPWIQKRRRVATPHTRSPRKITPTNMQTTVPRTKITATERNPTGVGNADTGSLGTAPGTRIKSRTTTRAINSGAATNPRIATVTGRGKGCPGDGMRPGTGTGRFTSASDFCPFVSLVFLFLSKSCIPPPSNSILGVYIAIICDLSCIFCTAVAWIATA